MQSKRYNIWEENEYHYSMAYGFEPNIVSYLHPDESIRPCIIVVPGGSYAYVSPAEGEIVAKEFYSKGYHTFVLTYTTNLLSAVPLKTQPMQDLSRAIRFIRKHSEDFHIHPDQITVCGFSAGGHLCGSVCVHHKEITDLNPKYNNISNRPNSSILSYPVITSGSYAHRGSFLNLLGNDASAEDLDYMSLEKQVNDETPPCFLWHTVEDQAVPVENSYLYAAACRSSDVPFAHHVFSEGRHGLSLANELWTSGEHGKPYTLEQTAFIIDLIKSGDIQVSEEQRTNLMDKFNKTEEEYIHSFSNEDVKPEVAVWPSLAVQWLKTIYKLHHSS